MGEDWWRGASRRRRFFVSDARAARLVMKRPRASYVFTATPSRTLANVSAVSSPRANSHSFTADDVVIRRLFAPATPEPVDDERYEALFDTMYQLRLAIAKRRKDDTGQHFAADRVVPLRLLESFARHPPPTFAALEREIAEKSFDIAEMVFLRTHKERVWKAIENGLARYRNEPEPHGVLVTPAPAARPPSIRSFEFNGTQPQPQWQRAGQGQG